MDVAPFWRDMVCNKTEKTSGSKYDTAETTRYEKTFVSVYLATKADDTKLLLTISFKGAKQEIVLLDKQIKKYFLFS